MNTNIGTTFADFRELCEKVNEHFVELVAEHGWDFEYYCLAEEQDERNPVRDFPYYMDEFDDVMSEFGLYDIAEMTMTAYDYRCGDKFRTDRMFFAMDGNNNLVSIGKDEINNWMLATISAYDFAKWLDQTKRIIRL